MRVVPKEEERANALTARFLTKAQIEALEALEKKPDLNELICTEATRKSVASSSTEASKKNYKRFSLTEDAPMTDK